VFGTGLFVSLPFVLFSLVDEVVVVALVVLLLEVVGTCCVSLGLGVDLGGEEGCSLVLWLLPPSVAGFVAHLVSDTSAVT
jgi:hypothetical protein